MVTAEFLDYYRKITETLHFLAGKHFNLAISTFGISYFLHHLAFFSQAYRNLCRQYFSFRKKIMYAFSNHQNRHPSILIYNLTNYKRHYE